MAAAEQPKPELKRSVGLISLTLIAAGGILGSGWLFSPLLTAQLAGAGLHSRVGYRSCSNAVVGL